MGNQEEKQGATRRATTKREIRRAITPPLHDIQPIVGLSLPQSFSSMAEASRRKLASELSHDARGAGKKELEGFMPTLVKARREETDAETAQRLDEVIEEAAWKGCPIKDALFSIGESLRSEKPFSERERGLKIIDHAIRNKHDIFPLLSSLVPLLSDFDTKITAIAADLLKKYASTNPTYAWQVKVALESVNKKNWLGIQVMNVCDSVIDPSAAQQPGTPGGTPKKGKGRNPVSDRRALADTLPEITPPKAQAAAKAEDVHGRRIEPMLQPQKEATKSGPEDKSSTPTPPQGRSTASHDQRIDSGPSIRAGGRKADRLDGKVKDLTSEVAALRKGAVKYLIGHIDSPEKARDILPVLPPDSKSEAAAVVRSHCIQFLKRGF